jgi:RNA polymerase sigma-70 factor, ECF subfamily
LLDLLTSHEDSPTAQLTTDERKQWVAQAIADLPQPLRDVVLLVYFQDMKYREAAEALDIPVGTVKSRMHAAVAKLNEAWNHSHPESN